MYFCNMQVIPLSEGAFTIDKTKVFIPFNKETDNIQDRPAGSLLVEVQPFVVITNNDVIVIDDSRKDTIDKLKDETSSVVCFMGCAYVDGLISAYKKLVEETK